MFPHNSSSHEISTETNAFVQNSKGDVVVLEGSSLSGVGEGEGPERARYCDIEFINSSMMAAPTSHPEATAANDFLTVLPRQSGELSSAGVGEARQSVAPATTKNPRNHLLTYDNNNKVNHHNNAEHNHHKYRKQNTQGSPGQLGSSADNSKSTCKPLSDNKDSFSDLSVRVLKVSLNLEVTRGDACRPAGVPSLVRIPKSDRPQRLPRLAASVDNYSLLGSRLDQGDNNNLKANLSFVSNNNSKSVILLSSTSYGDYYLLPDGDHVRADAVAAALLVENDTSNRSKGMKLLGDKCYPVTSFAPTSRRLEQSVILDEDNNDKRRGDVIPSLVRIAGRPVKLHFDRAEEARKFAVDTASSSITLIVSEYGITEHTLRSTVYLENLTRVQVPSPTSPLGHAPVTELTQRICVPLTIKYKDYVNDIANNYYYYYYYCINNNNDTTMITRTTIMTIMTINENNDDHDDFYDDCCPRGMRNLETNAKNEDKRDATKKKRDKSSVRSHEDKMNISNNNPDVIEDIVNVALCYKTSCIMTTNVRMLGSQNDGISRTEATIFTVGALSFQDNDKSNKPLNASFKDDKYQVSTKVDLKSNSNVKSVSKSTLSVKSSDKSETSHTARLDESDDEEEQVRSAVNIPTLTTCEPTMTLTRQSATVTSQTNAVPASRVENHSNDDYDDDDDDDEDDHREYRQQKKKKNYHKHHEHQYQHDDETTGEEFSWSHIQSDRVPVNEYVTPSLRETQIDEPVPDSIKSRKMTSQQISYGNSKGLAILASTCNESRSTARAAASRKAELISLVRAIIPALNRKHEKYDESQCEDERRRLKDALSILFERTTSKRCQDLQEPIMDYKRRWGIPTILCLAGGGESSLNSGGAANWGTTQATTPNNNNAAQSGWGGTPGNPPGSAGPPSNWGGNNVNRSVTGNPNQNQNQGPPGTQNNPGNVNKANNPNQPPNSQSGPPTTQSNTAAQGNQNNAQWPQGKSNNPGGPGQNPAAQNNNSSAGQPQQQPPGPNANNNPASNPTQGAVTPGAAPAANNPSTKQQLEQLNTMREALFSQDGWGCQHVNQDTNWDVPTSPEPSMTKDGVPMWKPPVNNGTDLWEANLRNGGQPPPQQQAKTPWGHTPSTNIGGTWGEDDDAADSSMWTGAPTSSQPNTAQWPGGAGGNQAGMWRGGGMLVKAGDADPVARTGSSWGDPRIDPRDPRDLRPVDPREMRDPRDHRMSLDPRDHMRVMDPMGRDHRMADMRGDSRGISGRLNGASADAMWGQPPGPPHHQMGHQHPSGPPVKMLNPSSMNQWAAPPPKDMMPGKPSGWEEPSPPTQRRNVPNYDDGTSLWGNPGANQRAMPGSKVSHWKDLPTPNLGRGGTQPGMQCPPGMPQNRMPGQPGMKPDVGGPMWGHPGGPAGRNGSWVDGPHDAAGWDDPKTPAGWNEPQLNPATWGGPTAHKPKPMGPSGSWADSEMDPTPSWGHQTKPALTKEVIWNSREFRYLCDLGYKKEDVEVALRSREMNRDEAQELLNQLRPVDQWRRHDAHAGYDPTNQVTPAPAYPRFNHVAQQMSFPPGAGVPSGAATGGVSGSVASASLLKLQQQQQQQQAAVQLQQQQPSANAPQPPFNQASRTPQNQPSTQQLRMLVQQIQLAVQEGYLNHQILNQPLAPQTLILLNQLLQQIKVLQQLHQQHSVQTSLKGNSQTLLQISVQITKTKQQITNLQNQIAVQQATYMKQQQQQQHPAAPSQASEYYKTSVHDPMSALQNSFSDLTMNKEPSVSQQQSRLNQWKLPSLDKDGDIAANEFSRAPGTTSKPPTTPGGLAQSHSSPNMNPLLGQGDGTWSSRLGDSGWPDAGNSDSTDGKDWQPGGAAFTDLVPEFEPGKPWKGPQMKSIEDDPSITPGSVVRSPLSLAAIKDPDAIFSSSTKTSPPPQSANVDTSIPSLSNSTWSFNPPATTPSAFTSSKNTWGDSAPPPTSVTSELWGAPMSKARGPPPGLGSKGAANASNGWGAGLGSVSRSSSSWGLQSSAGGNAGWVSTWLLLKNLTPQIDGSTLKTLCMQHGPVQDFRLYLNHGIALTKYSSRDEAIKAQGALNNCVLGNTTIFAESPADSEVHTLLQQLSHGGQQQTGGSGGSGWGLRPTSKAGPPPDTWGGSSSQLWGAPPSTNSLWSNTGIDSSDQQRATPSSLNSYLPGDLLGGESM